MTHDRVTTGARLSTRASLGAALVALLLLPATRAGAQRATEQFIPIGRSPGLSEKRTYVGTIASVDAGARTLALGTGAARHEVRVTASTRIWVDRTRLGKTNVVGSFEDLVAGRRVEVKYEDAEAREEADWIKVAPEQGG